MYGIRGIQGGLFPYVEGGLQGGDLVDGGIEYPVLTGLFMWLVGTFVSNDGNTYLKVSAMALAPFGILTAYWLARMVKWRALLWAAAPAVVLYAFHNWDLLVVAVVVAGLWYWWRDRPLGAAVMFGIGGCLKLYPLFFLAALFMDRLARGDRRGALNGLAAGAGTFALINLPFALVNFEGWWATYEFHRLRGPNYDSMWYLRFPQLPPETLNLLTGGLTLATFAAALGYGWVRWKREGVYPFLQVAGAMLAGFLLWNKVHSPQYTLWLLPFFALLNVNTLWWAAYSAVDLTVYIGVFRFFYETQLGQGNEGAAFRAMSIGVYGRAILLAALIIIFLMARRAGELDAEREQGVVSHPPPKVSAVGEEAPA